MKFISKDELKGLSDPKDQIEERRKTSPAIRSALNILDYADNTEKKLKEKLSRKNFSADEIEEALTYVKDIGYLNEEEHIKNAADYMAEVKLYGRYRIKKALLEKGFSSDMVKSLDLSEYDFTEICERRIGKSRYRTKDSLIAALRRYGFSGDEIITAIEETGVFSEDGDEF